jgi:hypothetical protein
MAAAKRRSDARRARARRDAFLHKIKSRLVFIVTFFVAGKVFFVTALVAAQVIVTAHVGGLVPL